MPLADNSLIRFSLLRHLEGAYWILRGNFVFQVDLSGSYFIDLLETYVGERITGDFNKLNLDLLCRQFGLRKCVKSPTRGNAILDQILTNMSHLFEPAQHLPPLGRSDHQCLLFKPKQRMKLPPITKKFRPMKPGNLQTLQAEMSKETWESVINAEDVDDKVFIFNTLVTNMLDIAMPEKSVRVHPSDKPWITPFIKNCIKE
jgi:hypothetical protein